MQDWMPVAKLLLGALPIVEHDGESIVGVRWEDRFRVSEYIFRKAPNYFLMACKPLLPPSGCALVIAEPV